MMQKLGFIGMKNLDQFKSLTGSASGTAKTLSISSRSNSDSITSGSFANLKLTAEKLVKEQASVRTDLDMANSKLKKSLEHIQMLEEKLQAAFNENAKLKVKQKEDGKLWHGLESKFSSTKTLSEQLTETLQVLACQVQDAEKDKRLIEEKLVASSAALDSLNNQMNDLSLKLETAEETIKDRDQAVSKLKMQIEEREAFYGDEKFKTGKLVEEKDAVIKCLEADVIKNKVAGENLKSKLDDANVDLKQKEENLSQMKVCLENLEREKVDLLSSNHDFARKLATSLQETQNLKDMVNAFASELIELDKRSVAASGKIAQLCCAYDSFTNLVEHERDLTAKRTKEKYDLLDHQYEGVKSEKSELQYVNQGLHDKCDELQRAQESAMVQHAEECRLTEERIRKFESEVEVLISKKSEAEQLVGQLEEKVSSLLESLGSSENEKKELQLKMSVLESERDEIMKQLQVDLQKKEDEIDGYQKEIASLNSQVQALEGKVNKLDASLVEKEQLILQCVDKEKHLEYKKTEIEALLATAERKLGEAKKQYDAMLDSKQSELSRHLKEISQRNDQAINDIRKKYETEKQEILNLEKEKVDKIAAEWEQKYEQRLNQCEEESRQNLFRVQEEHAALIICMRKEQEEKELTLKSDHHKEVKHIQLQAENDLREKTMILKNEYDSQLRGLRLRHEDECRQLQQELDLQKSKEEKQKALLQLQWKVMGNEPHEDQEINSKKDYSVSSIRDPGVVKKGMQAQDTSYQTAVASPVSTLLKKVEKANSGNIMDISKQKVTHRDYEVETTYGGTVTKRRKSKSTVMFGDPRKHRKVATPKITTPRISVKGTRAKGLSQSTNIGDLFSEGSLDPYAVGDDPYAFD